MKRPIYLLFSLIVLLFAYQSKAQTSSRLVAQSLYTFEDGIFSITDTTKYSYTTTKRGGDLNSKYIAFDKAEQFISEKATSTLVKSKLALQNFDIYNNRTVEQHSNYNLSIGAFENTETIFYYTTIDDTLTSTVKQTWNASSLAWENSTRQIFTHDAAGHRNSKTFQFWNAASANWTNYERSLFAFDLSGNMTSNLYQTWDVSTSNWVNIFNDSMSYSSTNKLVSSITQLWLSGNWENNKKVFYLYDVADNVTESQEQGWDASSSAWYNVKKYEYTHDGRGNILTFINQNWNSGLSKWDTFNRREYSFDSKNNLLSNTWSFWDASKNSFENSSLESYTYDAYDNLLTETAAIWDNIALDWENTEKVTRAYNSFNQKTLEQNEFWDPIAKLWMLRNGNQKFNYYYESYTNSIAENKSITNELKLFPVPSADVLNVQLKSGTKETLTGQIIATNGRLIRQWTINSNKEFKGIIPINDLPPGQYVIQFLGKETGTIKGEFQVLK